MNDIDLILQKLDTTAAHVIEQYTHYYLYGSLFLAFCGSLLFLPAWYCTKKSKTSENYSGEWVFASIVMFLIGFFMCILNLSDAISPEARAIHHLIKDVRG